MALQVRGEGDARHRRTPRSESLPAAGDDCNCQQTDRVERRLSSQCLSLRDSQISVARSEIVIPAKRATRARAGTRSEEHTSELQSLMRISYAVFCLKKK